MIKEMAQNIKIYEKEINSSGNIQTVVKNLRLLLEALDALASVQESDLREAGISFSRGSAREWYENVDSVKHQIISQVPLRSNYERSSEFQPLPPQAMMPFEMFSCIHIDEPKTSVEKLLRCQKALQLLPSFVFASLEMEGDEFEIPYICYVSVELCLLLGEWDRAIQIANYCNSCNAFYSQPQEYNNFVTRIDDFKATASVALQFIKENPGFLQKNMYKALSDSTAHEHLQHFLRSSELIRKERDGATYKLYIKDTRLIPYFSQLSENPFIE